MKEPTNGSHPIGAATPVSADDTGGAVACIVSYFIGLYSLFYRALLQKRPITPVSADDTGGAMASIVSYCIILLCNIVSFCIILYHIVSNCIRLYTTV